MARTAIVLLSALVAFGCSGVTVTTQGPQGAPITVKSNIGGRGCIAAEVDPATGTVNIVTSQDGTSDWAGVRAIPLLAQTALTTVLGAAPGETVGMDGPSIVGGCDGLFVDELDVSEIEEESP